MRLAYYAMTAGTVLFLALFHPAQANQEDNLDLDEDCTDDCQCKSKCCGTHWKPKAECHEKGKVLPGGKCYGKNGCDCLGSALCTNGKCEDCVDDNDCPRDLFCCDDGTCKMIFECVTDVPTPAPFYGVTAGPTASSSG